MLSDQEIERIESRLRSTTDGPWSQGRLLLTKQTGKWPLPLWNEANDKEKIRIFTWFSPLDEGKGRQFVAEARNEADAIFIANAKKDIANLIYEIKRLRAERESFE